ncbi:MAG: hypothetical protein KGJ79_14710 [Alphaproteobacteria bacterium]|nr:hypothetical protein [Alphaproteobacteria bacterium]MDE2112393.1 hypothetical protein [Alphaproteobacteria bacterium]MDE2495318.1 hypothetical protein [Alphaproteobacteria bacterium]
MGWERAGWAGAAAVWFAASLACAQTPALPSAIYVVRADRWSASDEREYGRFIAELGESGCVTVNACLHDLRNPYRGSDPPGVVFESDCADFPYVLRFYFAWKRGLPFSYESDVEPRGAGGDLRYDFIGNAVAGRIDVKGGVKSGYEILNELRDAVSSATYRIQPDLEEPYEQDFYSPAITPKAIRPGTVIYDPNGHLAIVWRVDPDGRIQYIDAHPDFTVTRGFYDLRFVRAYPGMGAGFKNWRPQRLVGAARLPDGTLAGGHIVLAADKDIPDFSTEQFYGNGPKPADDKDWSKGVFTLNKEKLDYYDFVRAEMAGGRLAFDPLREVADMVDSNCSDLHYRVLAVDLAIQAGLNRLPEPDRLPPNIYGTEGDWETYSTPSRDARLKTAFKELRDTVARFMGMYRRHDKKLSYRGKDLAADMLAVYERHAARCRITYTRSDGSKVALGYEQLRRRLFDLSFDPYQCAERRWGAISGEEFAPCPDNTLKTAWYEAERNLRNQIDRTYEVPMDFTLAELKTPGPGKGVPYPPDTDVIAYLTAQIHPAQTGAASGF